MKEVMCVASGCTGTQDPPGLSILLGALFGHSGEGCRGTALSSRLLNLGVLSLGARERHVYMALHLFQIIHQHWRVIVPYSINSPIPTAQPPCQITKSLWMPCVNCRGPQLSVRCRAGPSQMAADEGYTSQGSVSVPRKSAWRVPYSLCLSCSGDLAWTGKAKSPGARRRAAVMNGRLDCIPKSRLMVSCGHRCPPSVLLSQR